VAGLPAANDCAVVGTGLWNPHGNDDDDDNNNNNNNNNSRKTIAGFAGLQDYSGPVSGAPSRHPASCEDQSERL
jgi:hypothetical protein